MAQEQTPNIYEGTVRTKYLDWTGLSKFWDRAKQYISDEILSLDSTKIPMVLDQTPRVTISAEIEKIWGAIGGDGNTNISGSINQILGAYVKSVKGADGTYIDISINGVDLDKKTEGAIDVELVVDETSLNNKFNEITSKNYVNTIQVNGDSGITVTSTDNKSTGDVVLALDTTALQQSIQGISTSYVKSLSVAEAEADGNDYVKISKNTTTGDVTVTVDDTGVKNAFEGVGQTIDGINGEISGVKEVNTQQGTLITGLRTDVDALKTNHINTVNNDEGNTYIDLKFTKNGNVVTPEVIETGLVGKFSEVGQSIANINAKDGEQDGQIASISQALSGHTASDHVTKFGGQTGVITLDDDAANSTGGTVKFAMSGNKLTASVRGLGNAAYVNPEPYTTAQIEGIFVTQS